MLATFPDADIPVVQLSLDASKPLAYHVDLGARLAPLQADGVLVMGSGNAVHHLGRLDWSRPDDGYDWAERFGSAVSERLTNGDPASLVDLEGDRDFNAVPRRTTSSGPLPAGAGGRAGER